MSHRFAIVLSSALGLASAQAFVVDAANGPGAQFSSIVAAVAAVPDGAVLVVRPGSYVCPTLLAKGLTLLGQPGARLVGLNGTALRIEGLAAHQQVSVRGFLLEPVLNLGRADIVCLNNQGAVTLESIQPAPSIYSTRHLIATGNDRLLCRALACNAITELSTSNAVLVGCELTASGIAAPGLRVTGGTVQIVSGTVTGSFGLGYAGGPAIAMNGGDLRLLGGVHVTGGLGVGGPSGHAVEGVGTVRVDPDVVLGGATPWLAPTLATSTAPQAFVEVTPAPLGMPVTARMYGPVGQLGVLAVGFPGPSYTVPGITDPLFWDPSSAVTQVLGVPAAGAPLLGVVAVPNHTSFLGLSLLWHGLSYAPATGLLVSNPGCHVVH